MIERQGPGPDKSEGMTRREFIAAMVGSAAGVTFSNVERAMSSGEKEHLEAVGRVAAFSKRKEDLVPSGAGLDTFYYGSGWDDDKDGYSREVYWDAIKLVNEETHPDLDTNHLIEGKSITILIKKQAEKE